MAQVTLADRLVWEQAERDKARALAAALKPHHVRTLEHITRVYGIFGWENFRDTEAELELLGLIRGEWMGSLDAPARPHWTATALGRKVLEALKTNEKEATT